MFIVPVPLPVQDSKLTVAIPGGPSKDEVPAIKVRTDPTVVAQVLLPGFVPARGLGLAHEFLDELVERAW